MRDSDSAPLQARRGAHRGQVVARIACCALGIFFVQIAAAGVWIVEAGTDFRTGAALARTMRLEAGRASIEIRDATRHQTIIYQSAPKRVWMVDHEQRFYRVLGDENLATLTKQLSGVREEMGRRAGEQLANMSEQQRSELSQSMKGRAAAQPEAAPSAGVTETEFTQAWQGESVNGRTCDKYEGSRNGQKVWDVCAVPWNRLDVERSDLVALEELIEYLVILRLWSAGAVIEPGPADWKERKLYPGLPVQRIRYANDRPIEVFEIREMERREFSASDFEPPSGYMERAVLLFSPQAAPEESTGNEP
ncbi:MAG TPA: hypothetical protein VML01_04730 [Bryobacterales bacterium]|nr:hypothetical protein [Bryobacterales bacterium]